MGICNELNADQEYADYLMEKDMSYIKHDQEAPDTIWLYKYPDPWGGVTTSDGSFHPMRGGLSDIAKPEQAKKDEIESIRYVRADTVSQTVTK